MNKKLTIQPADDAEEKILAALQKKADLRLYSDRQAWLDARRGGIGGSEAASLYHLGFNPPLGVYLDKTIALPEIGGKKAPTRAMEMGIRLEPTIRAF